MTLRRFATASAVVAAGLLSGCATAPPVDRRATGDQAVSECIDWFESLDRQIDGAGVRDAEDHRLPGFPYLRSNRFLASFAEEMAGDRAGTDDWLARLRELDRVARVIEIGNLPDAALPALHQAGRAGAIARAETCAAQLMRSDRARPATLAQVRERAAVPDDYATARRIAGLYAVTSLPFFAGVRRWQDATLATFAREHDIAFDTMRQVRHVPAAETWTQAAAARRIATTPRDRLGIPQYAAAERAQMIAAYAPVFEVETRRDDDSDRPGHLEWRDPALPAVNTRQAQVYTRMAFTRFQGEVLTQLVYAPWFPRRPADGPFDLVAGALDGVIVRLTLDRDGSILMMDSIHACGCYQEFFPSDRLRARSPPVENEEWAFVPAPLPTLAAGARLMIRLASGSHYITRVTSADSADGAAYTLADDSLLRALPLAAGTRSLFGPDGLVAGSERAERWLFWPMGIASPGAMRQWGHHATAFVGRRHFDDARLIDLRFARTGD